jgi:adenosine deaminase
MRVQEFAKQLPKVELHVHLEGSIRPETVLKLAARNRVDLPANTVEGLRDWYRFVDFPHFVEVYVAISRTIKNPEDLELITREFLQGQAGQNVLHSDVTFTASTIEQFNGIPWPEQLAAINRAREYGEKELGTSMSLILDIVRGHTAERALEVASWAVEAMGNGVGALGLAGEEARGEISDYRAAFNLAREAGLPIIPHAGETEGPWSVAACLRETGCTRIGHGVRSIEDPEVIDELTARGVTLEVCPSSNVCLRGYPSLKDHPFAKLVAAGLTVTINSDDPPMFDTTLTDEYIRVAETFGFSNEDLRRFDLAAARVALVSESRRRELVETIEAA